MPILLLEVELDDHAQREVSMVHSFLFPRKTVSLGVFAAVVFNGHCSAGLTVAPHTLELVNKFAYFKSTLAGKNPLFAQGCLWFFNFFNTEMQVMLQDLLYSSSQLCYLITQVLIPYITCYLTYYISFLFLLFFFVEEQNENLVAVSDFIHFPFPRWSLMD